jgi:biotin transport system substrate-specific component
MTHAALLERNVIELAIRTALWAGLITAGAYISIPIGPVPITLQTFFIILCGFVEGPRAFFAVLIYLLAGLMGLPVFAGGFSGPGLLFGPSAGFALAFPPAALIAGLSKFNPRAYKYILYGSLASLLILAAGVLGLHLNIKVSYTKAFFIALPFLPGDGFKVIAATFLMSGGGELFRRYIGLGAVKKPLDNSEKSDKGEDL